MRPGKKFGHAGQGLDLRSFEDLPEDLQDQLVWLHGEERAHEIKVPEVVLNAREERSSVVEISNIAPGAFIRSDGLFLHRDENGSRSTHGQMSYNGFPYLQVNNFKHWAHVKVFEAFIGPIPAGYRVMMIDGRNDNCDITNLALEPKPQESSRYDSFGPQFMN